MKILIVKTSSLGDIVQAFCVLDYLKSHFPEAEVDWVAEKPFLPLISAHPFVNEALSSVRDKEYDLLFDLQGNCKSGLITFWAKAKVKVGYALGSAREWPNVLATHVRFKVSKEQNIRSFYLELLERYLNRKLERTLNVHFAIEGKAKEKVLAIANRSTHKKKIMVCPGSRWANKRLDLATWNAFLQKVEARWPSSFFLIFGNEEERLFAEQIAVKEKILVDKLELPILQNLMNEMDLVLAVDSGALHLSGTAKCKTFSIFGPTKAEVFAPLNGAFLQGACPYGVVFTKQCPHLRTCKTGACMKIDPEILFQKLFDYL